MSTSVLNRYTPIEAETMCGIVRRTQVGLLRLLHEAGYVAFPIYIHDPKVPRLRGVHKNSREGDIRTGILMLSQHEAVIHLVDMVAGENKHVAATAPIPME